MPTDLIHRIGIAAPAETIIATEEASKLGGHPLNGLRLKVAVKVQSKK